MYTAVGVYTAIIQPYIAAFSCACVAVYTGDIV